MGRQIRIALAGKPNAGKSSLFNLLTGLNQKIGNFPGVTVDKKAGYCSLPGGITAEIIDLPGAYSLYPRTLDEQIVTEIFVDQKSAFYPDAVVVVADATNLKNCFLLLTQLIDLKLPVVLALNMMDLAARSGQNIDIQKIQTGLDVPVVMINARTGSGLHDLKKVLAAPVRPSSKKIYPVSEEIAAVVLRVQAHFNLSSPYQAYQLLQQPHHILALSDEERAMLKGWAAEHNFFPAKYQGAETITRYGFIQQLLHEATLQLPAAEWKRFSYRIDSVVTHRVWGYAIFLGLLFLIFQSVFAWAQVPMDWIDQGFALLSGWLNARLPAGPFSDLFTQGVIPGIGGIVIFIPQIAILFAFISVLEETGYMARVVFLMDKLMRKFGLSGKSVVPLISGFACAIPAIMATRTIENWKERLTTILVTPFISCSARLPVFAILVAVVIPEDRLFGFFNLQGLALMGLYLLGVAAALGSAAIMKWLIHTRERSFLMMELPTYRMPKWSNVGYTLVEKTKTFVLEAGKVILAISIVLWVLASYGPAHEMEQAETGVRQRFVTQGLDTAALANELAAARLEHSYAGKIGRLLEPLIAPLGYDWKIGIALVTSFAAREVFVGTMATIYSLGSTEDTVTIRARLQSEVNPATGGPRFTLAVGLSLLVFYTFAMQCMSTLAVVRRETKTWKWPLLQLLYMSGLAYLSAFIVFQALN
jgi:ferrous iron transport protein B